MASFILRDNNERNNNITKDDTLLAMQLLDKQFGLLPGAAPTPPQQQKQQRRISWENINLEKLLGEGGCACVFQAKIFDQQTNTTKQYALKCVSPRHAKNKGRLIEASYSLASEVSIMSQLNHQNILSIQGVSSTTFTQSYLGGDNLGYFMIMDVLNGTLDDKIQNWNRSMMQSSSKKPSRQDIQQRIGTIGLGIAQGMEYLHTQNIVLRDLKPANIGFDSQTGKVKIFDFGLACHVDDCKKIGVAGSCGYVAPESLVGNCSGFPTDVYSFAIVLWEMSMLSSAFGSNFPTQEQIHYHVVVENWRPTLRKIPIRSLRNLISLCWDQRSNDRPTFTQICQRIKKDFDICSNSISSSSDSCTATTTTTTTTNTATTSITKKLAKNLFKKINTFTKRSPYSIAGVINEQIIDSTEKSISDINLGGGVAAAGVEDGKQDKMIIELSHHE